jgi:hypothetical protein
MVPVEGGRAPRVPGKGQLAPPIKGVDSAQVLALLPSVAGGDNLIVASARVARPIRPQIIVMVLPHKSAASSFSRLMTLVTFESVLGALIVEI